MDGVALRVLLVDDEPLARLRLRQLLGDCGACVAGECASAESALAWLATNEADAVLVDIGMPGTDGLAFSRHMATLPRPPSVIFVTAHDQHAVEAFELGAVDYLLKPVRRERLVRALERVPARPQPSGGAFRVRGRNRLLLVPYDAARLLRASEKYVELHAVTGMYLLDEPLVVLEARLGPLALRIHRNCLVMRQALRGLLRPGNNTDEGWLVQLEGLDEPLPVSRRQLAHVKQAFEGARHAFD